MSSPLKITGNFNLFDKIKDLATGNLGGNDDYSTLDLKNKNKYFLQQDRTSQFKFNNPYFSFAYTYRDNNCENLVYRYLLVSENSEEIRQKSFVASESEKINLELIHNLNLEADNSYLENIISDNFASIANKNNLITINLTPKYPLNSVFIPYIYPKSKPDSTRIYDYPSDKLYFTPYVNPKNLKDNVQLYYNHDSPVFILNNIFDYELLSVTEKEIIDYYHKYALSTKYDLIRRDASTLCSLFEEPVIQSMIEKRYLIPRDYLIKYTASAPKNFDFNLERSYYFEEYANKYISNVSVNTTLDGVVIYPEDMNEEEYFNENGNFDFYNIDNNSGLEDIGTYIASEKGFSSIPIKNYLKDKAYEKIGQYDLYTVSKNNPNVSASLYSFYLQDTGLIKSNSYQGYSGDGGLIGNQDINNFIKLEFNLFSTKPFYDSSNFKYNVMMSYRVTFDDLFNKYYNLELENMLVKKKILDPEIGSERYYYESRYALFNVINQSSSADRFPFVFKLNSIDPESISFSYYLLDNGSGNQIDNIFDYNCPNENDDIFIKDLSLSSYRPYVFLRCISENKLTKKPIVIYYNNFAKKYYSIEISNKFDFSYSMHKQITPNLDLYLTYQNSNKYFNYYLRDSVNNKIYPSHSIGDYYSTDTLFGSNKEYHSDNFNVYNSNSIFIYKRIDFTEKSNSGQVKLVPFFEQKINNIPLSLDSFSTLDKDLVINIGNHTFAYNYFTKRFIDKKYNRLVDINNLVYDDNFRLSSDFLVFNSKDYSSFLVDNMVSKDINFMFDNTHDLKKINLLDKVNLDLAYVTDLGVLYKLNCKNSGYPFCYTDPEINLSYDFQSTNHNVVYANSSQYATDSGDINLFNYTSLFINKISIQNPPPKIDLVFGGKCDAANTYNDYSLGYYSPMVYNKLKFSKSGELFNSNYKLYTDSKYVLDTLDLKDSDFSLPSNAVNFFDYFRLELYKFNNKNYLCVISGELHGILSPPNCVEEGTQKLVSFFSQNAFCEFNINFQKVYFENTKKIVVDYVPLDKFSNYYKTMPKSDAIFDSFEVVDSNLLQYGIDLSIQFLEFKDTRVYPDLEDLEISPMEFNKNNFLPEEYFDVYRNNKSIVLGVVYNNEVSTLSLPVKNVYKKGNDYYATFEDTFIPLASSDNENIILWHLREIKLPTVDFDVGFVNNFGNTLVESSNFETAKKIKDNINYSYDQNKFKYLMIMGDFGVIPVITTKDVGYKKDEGYNKLYNLMPIKEYDTEFDYVLDSLYFGNINDDPLVELSVGRLPFLDEEDYIKYYTNWKQGIDSRTNNMGFTSRINNNYFVYPDSGYILSPERLISKFNDIGVYVNLPIDKNYTASTQRSINSGIFQELIPKSYVSKAKEFENLPFSLSLVKPLLLDGLQNSNQVYFTTHGSTNSFTITDINGNVSDIVSVSQLPYFSNRPLIFAESCSTASSIGREFLNKGVIGYIGAYNPLYINYDIFPFLSDSTKVSDLIKYHQNFYMSSPYDKRLGLESVIYLGDPTFNYKPIYSTYNSVNNVSQRKNLDLKNNKIIFSEDSEDLFSFGLFSSFSDGEGFYTYLTNTEIKNLITKNIQNINTEKFNTNYVVQFGPLITPCKASVDYFYIVNDRQKDYVVNSTKYYNSSYRMISDNLVIDYKEILNNLKTEKGIDKNISFFIKDLNIWCGEFSIMGIGKPVNEKPVWKKILVFFDKDNKIFYNINDGPIQYYGTFKSEMDAPQKINVQFYSGTLGSNYGSVLINNKIINKYDYKEENPNKYISIFEINYTYSDFFEYLTKANLNAGYRIEITASDSTLARN